MLKRIFSSLTALGAGSMMALMAQLTATEAFSSAPNSVFPLLDANTRLDMVDYFKSGMSTPSGNALNGQSVLTSLSDKELTVKMTDSSTAQLFIVSDNGRDIIALISTVATPGLDSKISFFDSNWNSLPSEKYFSAPKLEGWLNSEGKSNEAMVTMQVPFMLASYTYDPTTSTLTATNNLQTFLDSDIYSIVEPYLLPNLVYVWNGKKFSPAR